MEKKNVGKMSSITEGLKLSRKMGTIDVGGYGFRNLGRRTLSADKLSANMLSAR